MNRTYRAGTLALVALAFFCLHQPCPSIRAAQTQAEKKAARKAARKASTAPRPTFENVNYGPSERNLLDFWQAKSELPTPVVVYIHGGGFVGGDKSSATAQSVERCRENGVSYAAINYRFRTEVPIQVVLRDCARAIQFLRFKAKDWNIDKDRIAAHGGSAGAGTSLWLAFHDDLGDPDNSDPVLRESSRIKAAGATACQATYDIVRWKEVLGEDAVRQYSPDKEWPGFYGLKSVEEVLGPQGQKIRADVDMLGLIRKGGCPVWLGAAGRADGPATDRGHYLHHPNHAIAVKKKCDEMGVEAVLFRGEADKKKSDMLGFLLDHLGVKHAAP
jgi:hypothetical protein